MFVNDLHEFNTILQYI